MTAKRKPIDDASLDRGIAVLDATARIESLTKQLASAEAEVEREAERRRIASEVLKKARGER